MSPGKMISFFPPRAPETKKGPRPPLGISRGRRTRDEGPHSTAFSYRWPPPSAWPPSGFGGETPSQRKKTPPSVSEQGFPKGASAPFGRFKVGLGGKSKSLPEFFFGIVKGDSFNSERIPLDRQRAFARSPHRPPCGRLPRVPNGTRPTRPSPEAKNPLFYIGFYIESDGRKPKNEP